MHLTARATVAGHGTLKALHFTGNYSPRIDYLFGASLTTDWSATMFKPLLIAALLAASPLTQAGTDKPSAYIVSPVDGATVDNPVVVVFGLKGFGVAPAGTMKEKTGHHHLIIDAPLPDLSQPIPATDNYRHFGGGQTQTSVELAPGTHTLQILLGDHAHVPHEQPIYSEVITINVR